MTERLHPFRVGDLVVTPTVKKLHEEDGNPFVSAYCFKPEHPYIVSGIVDSLYSTVYRLAGDNENSWFKLHDDCCDKLSIHPSLIAIVART